MNSATPKPTNSDARRDLFEYEFPAAVTKVIVAKEDCTLGHHYHKIKTEYFVLLSGFGEAIFNKSVAFPMLAMSGGIRVDPGTIHTFHLAKGSILLGLCSHPYDPTDDYHA